MNKHLVKVSWVLVIALTLVAALYALGVLSFAPHVTQDDGYGNIYQGKMAHGDFIGAVEIAFADGSRWTGELKNGLFDGQGTFTSKDGWSYTGEFENGEAVDFAAGTFSSVTE
ncbi:MAG: hypothetical protein FWG00_06115 [Coriobacteriia bacterium]|nr:hypothetical protein [Coriobacteriia bacterium]